MNAERKNARTITQAFARLRGNQEKVCDSGIRDLLNAALKYLDEAHGLLNPGTRHIAENNTLGWAFIRDGVLVETVGHAGGTWTPKGDAIAKLQGIVSSLPKGYCGVVMSDMANSWYNWDWEEDYLHYSADNIKEEFFDFFKPI